MNYAAARLKICSGDLIAQSHRVGWYKSFYDFKIAMVRMFTKSEYSHVGIAFVLAGRVFMLEAVTPKVRIYPMSKIGDFYWLALDAPWTIKTEEVALSKVGYEYSQIRAMEAFFADLPAEDVSECAAYARCVLRADGIDLGDHATPDAVVRAAQLRDGVETIYVTNESQP